jgi:hypothetical protein
MSSCIRMSSIEQSIHFPTDHTAAVQPTEKISMLCTLAVPPNLSYVETSIVAVPEGLALSTATCAASRTLAMFNGLARRPATLGSLGGSVTGANATGIPGDMDGIHESIDQ